MYCNSRTRPIDYSHIYLRLLQPTVALSTMEGLVAAKGTHSPSVITVALVAMAGSCKLDDPLEFSQKDIRLSAMEKERLPDIRRHFEDLR